jgi:N-acetylneuraminate synthase
MIYIIAEIGINNEGSQTIAKELIVGAAKAGANAIKFQYRNLKRAYEGNPKELGDNMLKSEIEKNFLSTESIIELSKFARQLNLDVGISFFTVMDYYDFGDHNFFNFYKVPSVEFCNKELLKLLLKTNKLIYISTGCQNESTISLFMEEFGNFENINLLHCVSNYPLAPHNCNFGYIRYFKEKYGKDMGYSSHDKDWKFILFAVAFGAKVIERHITLGSRDGLDETTSSTLLEFTDLVNIIRCYKEAKKGYGPRKLNQGEMLNLQNLGRSFYLNSNQAKGSILKKKDLLYASPAVGLGVKEIDFYINKPIIKDVKQGEVLIASMFEKKKHIGSKERDFCNKFKISLPVRLHDLEFIRNDFSIRRYEFHLSYNEVDQGLNDIKILSNEQYSIHLPDYISPNHIIDPFNESSIGERSKFIINSTLKFARKIQGITGKSCPIIGSFSVLNFSKNTFYEKISNFCLELEKDNMILLPQWLPPIAWYFGGSVPLSVFNSSEDIKSLEKYNLKICFDSAHFLMSCNAGLTDANKDFDRLMRLTHHIHISGAEGLDGEGTSFNSKNPIAHSILTSCLNKEYIKVIETWQGHLDNFSGFHQSIYDLISIKK